MCLIGKTEGLRVKERILVDNIAKVKKRKGILR